MPLNMSVNQLAELLAVDAARLNEIVRGRRGITADTALRLARYLGTSPEFWLKLQVHYELRVARSRRSKRKSNEQCVRDLKRRRNNEPPSYLGLSSRRISGHRQRAIQPPRVPRPVSTLN